MGQAEASEGTDRNAAINRQVGRAAGPVGMPEGSDTSPAGEPVPEPARGHTMMDGAATIDS